VLSVHVTSEVKGDGDNGWCWPLTERDERSTLVRAWEQGSQGCLAASELPRRPFAGQVPLAPDSSAVGLALLLCSVVDAVDLVDKSGALRMKAPSRIPSVAPH